MCSAYANRYQYKAPSACMCCVTNCMSCLHPHRCLTCEAGFYSHNCAVTCPAGFTSSENQCLPVPSSIVIVRLTFDREAKRNTSPYFYFSHASGAGSNTHAPRYGSDLPIPSTHRGFYFADTHTAFPLCLLPSLYTPGLDHWSLG